MHIVVGLLIAFVIVAIFARRNRATRRCRWRADRTGDFGESHKYKCMSCGAETFTKTEGPPTICKSGQS